MCVLLLFYFDWLKIIQSSVVTWWIGHCAVCLLFRSHICQHPFIRLQLETRKEGDCHRCVVYLPLNWQCQLKGRWPNARIIPWSYTKIFQARDVWNHIKNINERCSIESILKQILPKSNFSNAYLIAPSYLSYIHMWFFFIIFAVWKLENRDSKTKYYVRTWTLVWSMVF